MINSVGERRSTYQAFELFFSCPWPLWSVGLFCAALGTIIGIASATPQVSLEIGQFYSGIVQYDEAAIYGPVIRRAWTATNQLTGLLLHFGYSDIAISVLISGLQGALACHGIGFVVYAITRSGFLAVVVPLFVAQARFFGVDVTYEVPMFGTIHTHGAMGVSFSVFILGLIANNKAFWAGFAIGFLPAIHLQMAFWLALGFAAIFWWNWRANWEILRSTLPGLAVGLALAGLSFLIHVRLAGVDLLAGLGGDFDRELWRISMRYWDYHRGVRPFEREIRGMASGAVIVFALIALARDKELPTEITAIFKVLAVLRIGAILYQLTRDCCLDSALAFVALMPGRMPILDQRLIGAIGIAVAFRYRGAAIPALALLLVSLGGGVQAISADPKSGLWGFPPRSAMYATLFVLATWLVASKPKIGDFARHYLIFVRFVALMAICVAGFLAVPRNLDWWGWPEMVKIYNDPVHVAASKGTGYILGPQMQSSDQMFTKRPLVIPESTGISYNPQSLNAVEQAYRDFYGVELREPFGPGMTAVNWGDRDIDVEGWIKPLWESRSQEEWLAIRAKYGVTSILTPPGWALKLPLEAESTTRRLWYVGS